MTPPTHPLQDGDFDPLALLRKNRGDAADTRTIKLRTLWLRQRVPEARIATAVVSLDDRRLVMSASITLPDGAEGSGHAATSLDERTDLAAAIETTELRAIGRALDLIGYVVLDQPAAPTPSAPPDPAEREPTPITRDRPEPTAPEDDAPAPPPTEDERGSRTPGHVQAIRSLRERGGRPVEPRPERTTRPERPAPTPIQPADDSDPALEDVSWTAFWSWARSTYQLSSRVQLEELLGQSIGQKTPGEVRHLLIERLGEGGDASE